MTTSICPDCGRPLPAQAPGGLCPACLLGLARPSPKAVSAAAPAIERDVLAANEQETETPAGTLIATSCLRSSAKGGFGTVWMAEQQEPVRRRVALKIIKLGMDTRQVVARFEAERQALALMDHPNIARVLRRRRHGDGPALLRDGTGAGRADHRVLRRSASSTRASGWSCSSRSARPSSTPTRRASSTATSSRPTSW